MRVKCGRMPCAIPCTARKYRLRSYHLSVGSPFLHSHRYSGKNSIENVYNYVHISCGCCISEKMLLLLGILYFILFYLFIYSFIFVCLFVFSWLLNLHYIFLQCVVALRISLKLFTHDSPPVAVVHHVQQWICIDHIF